MANFEQKNFKDIAIVILIFTTLDYLAHILSKGISFFPHLDILPEYYFIGKIILLAIAIPIVLKLKILDSTFKQCIVLAVLLQVRYFYGDYYDMTTNIIMIAIHYILLRVAFMNIERVSKLFTTIKIG